MRDKITFFLSRIVQVAMLIVFVGSLQYPIENYQHMTMGSIFPRDWWTISTTIYLIAERMWSIGVLVGIELLLLQKLK
jgi:hypothetical protein